MNRSLLCYAIEFISLGPFNAFTVQAGSLRILAGDEVVCGPFSPWVSAARELTAGVSRIYCYGNFTVAEPGDCPAH